MKNEQKELSLIERWALSPKLEFPQCLKCKNLLANKKCAAFPNGIPDNIMHNDVIHNHVFPEQTGLAIFESTI